jgi:hypothetical protein
MLPPRRIFFIGCGNCGSDRRSGARLELETARNGPHPSPLPCFLEVLILKDFKSFEPEVLILLDFKSLFPEVLILVGFKTCGIRKMQGIGELRGDLSEVLIPEGLKRNFSEVLILGRLRVRMGR